MAPRRDGQQLFQFDGNTFIDGHGADFAALTFDGDGVFSEGLFRNGRINAEALMAKTSKNAKREHEKSSKPFTLSSAHKQSSILASRPKPFSGQRR